MNTAEYKIITCNGPNELTIKVNEQIKQGWTIIGPANVSIKGIWFQTLTKNSV